MQLKCLLLVVVFISIANGFQMPVNRLASARKSTMKSKVQPQFAMDYKKSLASTTISLDRSPLPIKSSNQGGLLLFAALSIIVIQNFNFLLNSVLSFPGLVSSKVDGNILQKWGQNIVNRFRKSKIVDNSWNKCVLQSRSQLSDKFVQYRFAADPSVVTSDMAQVRLCSGDSKDNAQLDSFCCLNYPSEGYFDIIEEQSTSSNILSSISEGDEVAFSPKEFHLKLGNTQKSFFILAIGLGIIPTLQVINQIFSQSEAEVYLLWTNANKNDFIFNHYVKELENAYGQRLTVSRIVDESVDNARTAHYSERMKKCVIPFELGRVGTIIAPSSELPKAKTLLRDVSYPEDSVLVCEA